MPRSTLRFRVGTFRRRVVGAARDLRGRTRRTPPCSAAVPRPTLPRARRPLRLTHALLACDLAPRYLAHWPLTRRAWAEIAGLEPVLVLVADAQSVPEDVRGDPAVHVFEPLPNVHTAFQAQCVRLLYPALLEAEGVVVSDVDMVPLSRRFFHRPVQAVHENQFVAYRNGVLDLGEIQICYNAARPATWRAVFGVESLDNVRARLADWARAVTYAGVHGGEGWTTDQEILFRTLLERGRRSRDVWILDDHYTGFRRLERTYVQKWGVLSEAARTGIARRRYADYHCLPPDSELAGLNELIVELGIEAVRAGG